MIKVDLIPLTTEDREQFILDNQEVFRYGAMEEFGSRNEDFEEDGEIISKDTIIASIDGENAKTFRIVVDGRVVGGVILSIDEEKRYGELEILFISPKEHSKGIGQATWMEIENMFPDIDVWETMTPYFETRNIHFYVNKLGFHIVEFFNKKHIDPNMPEDDYRDGDGMFRFQKILGWKKYI